MYVIEAENIDKYNSNYEQYFFKKLTKKSSKKRHTKSWDILYSNHFNGRCIKYLVLKPRAMWHLIAQYDKLKLIRTNCILLTENVMLPTNVKLLRKLEFLGFMYLIFYTQN